MMRPKNSKCLFVANLDDRVDRAMLYELGTQAGKVVHVASTAKGYGFIEYETEDSCEYALKLFSGTVRLFGRAVRFDYGNRRER